MSKRFVIGVMGSAKNAPVSQFKKAKIIGREIALSGNTILTGATIGLTRIAARECLLNGGKSIGISPAANKKHHFEMGLPLEDTYIIFTGLGFTGRNMVNVRSSDAVIFIGGSNGTLNEFTIAYAEGKIIGVLKNSTGLTNHIECILKIVKSKKTGATIIIEENPKKLVTKVLKKLEKVKEF